MSYGFRRVVPDDGGPARREIFEPEAQIVREIFRAYVEDERPMRQIAHDLHDRGVPSPTGKPVCGVSTIGRMLRNEAYIGTVYYNRREAIDGNGPRGVRTRKTRYRERPARSGSRSQCPRSSTRPPSSAPSASAATTPSGTPAAPSPAPNSD